MVHRSRVFKFILILAIAAMPFAASAANVGKAYGGGNSIEWQLDVHGHVAIDVTVVAPSGQEYVSSAKGGQNPSFRLAQLGSEIEDGQYTYELRVVPNVPSDVAKKLQAARDSGDTAAARKIMKAAGLEAVTQSGAFRVVNGAIVDPNAVESSAHDSVTTNGRNMGVSTNATRVLKPEVTDTVIPDDLIVQGSACIGLDCVDGESFGFDTIRLKENNTRIKFDDTSASAGFPANDWQLTANDSASGGASKFSIEDITGAKVPFTVTAGASTNSIFVDSTGRVGFRTSTPVLDLHVATSNTPAIRLEQNNSGGFTAQTWDVAGNEANFFVRDVTSGSRLPFRIRPGAPTSSIDINASGNVGIGTASPANRLDVRVDGAGVAVGRYVNTSATGFSGFEFYDSDATTQATFFGTDNSANTTRINSLNNFPMVFLTNSVEHMRIESDGDVGINCNAPGFDLVIASAASGCTTPSSSINAGSAQFTVASSRTFKENIEPIAVPDLLKKIEDIDVYTYDFKNGPKNRLGLIAEDFHKVFNRGDEKFIDGSEVQMALWMAVQQLTKQNEALQQRLDMLEQKTATPEQQKQ